MESLPAAVGSGLDRIGPGRSSSPGGCLDPPLAAVSCSASRFCHGCSAETVGPGSIRLKPVEPFETARCLHYPAPMPPPAQLTVAEPARLPSHPLGSWVSCGVSPRP